MADITHYTMWFSDDTDDWVVVEGIGFEKKYHYFKELHKAVFFVLGEIPEKFFRIKIEVANER